MKVFKIWSFHFKYKTRFLESFHCNDVNEAALDQHFIFKKNKTKLYVIKG